MLRFFSREEIRQPSSLNNVAKVEKTNEQSYMCMPEFIHVSNFKQNMQTLNRVR